MQPGILNVARLAVQLSNGQQATPTCALTTNAVVNNGLFYTGASNGIYNTGAFGGGFGVNSGFSQFVMPEFSSATCRFNITFSSVSGSYRGLLGYGSCNARLQGFGARPWARAQAVGKIGRNGLTRRLLAAPACWLVAHPCERALLSPPPAPRSQFPGGTLSITPQVNWGFGGVYQVSLLCRTGHNRLRKPRHACAGPVMQHAASHKQGSTPAR